MSHIELRRLLQIFVLLATALLAFAAMAITKVNGIGHPETLLLKVTINTQLLSRVVRAEKLSDGRLALGLVAWDAVQLRLPEGEPLLLPDNQYGYALESVADLTYKLDHGQMTLTIMAPASDFIGNKINQLREETSLPDTVLPSFYIDYDL